MREVSWLLPVHQTSVCLRVVSSSLIRGDDEAEGVEFLELVTASSMRFWMEASSFRYRSRSMMKLVMSSWCYAWSWIRGKRSLWVKGSKYEEGLHLVGSRGSYARDFLGKGQEFEDTS